MEEPICDRGEVLTQSAEGPPCKLCLDNNPAAAQTHSFTLCSLLKRARALFSAARTFDEKSFTAIYTGQWPEEDLSSLFSEAQSLNEKKFIAFYIVLSQDNPDYDPYQDLRMTEAELEPDGPADLSEAEEDWPAAEYVFNQTYLSLC